MAHKPRARANRPAVPAPAVPPRAPSTPARHPAGVPLADVREPISRGDGARLRVLQAALDVLNDDGLAGFTMEAVARRAGASKATLYRRWPTVGALLVDAMDSTFQPLPVPDTGRVETDVAQLLGAFVNQLEGTRYPRLLAAFIDAAERDPTLGALHADLTRRRREPALKVLARARERGQLRGDLDLEVLTDLLAGPFFYRRFIAHRPIPPELVHDVIAHILTTPAPQDGHNPPVDQSTATTKSAEPVRRPRRSST
jgi:AcrR family transcriptional regulator